MSGDKLRLMAEEQAGLRRVATVVAGGASQEEVFAAVTEEVGKVLAIEIASIGRYESDGTASFPAVWTNAGFFVPPANRWALDGKNVPTLIAQTGRPARMDSFADASGPIGASSRKRGYRSQVGTPIVVEGRVWGLMIATSTADEPLPPDTEARLVSYTELLATAIANAESRADLGRLAAEQAALRRVATLVARGVPPKDVFAAVVKEIAQLLSVASVGMGRYESDDTVISVAAWGTAVAIFPVGSRWIPEGTNLVTCVSETGRPARIDDYADASGPVGAAARDSGFRSAVGTPIVVEDRLWGVVIAGSSLEQPLPPDTEERLSLFTELLATAVANAESSGNLAQLAQEQAALRRVATLVAQGVSPEELFAAVVEEVGQLLPVDYTHMVRYEPDGAITFVAVWSRANPLARVGGRLSLGGKNLGTMVFETGRPARIDGLADASGPIGLLGRQSGVHSAIGTPITVEGRLWGSMTAGSIQEPLASDTEERLAQFTALVGMAIANAETRAELTASRARIVAAADESRRRIERDLHDGAQQRLVHAVIVLKLALRALSKGEPGGDELVAEALRHAEQANSELRELAHGILPAALTRGGLRAGVDALASRASLPVSADVSVDRLPASVEATAYFVISEALTNVVKHARADGATVTARTGGGELRVEISDDGIGGAFSGENTGLSGLEDRVSALHGRLVLDSPPGRGTRVCALLPIPHER